MTKILFLDLDGVLNDHQLHPNSGICTIKPACMLWLNHVLEATDARIVIASAWRYMILNGSMTLAGFGYMLRTHGLRQVPATQRLGHHEHDEMSPIIGHLREDLKPIRNGDRARLAVWWLDDFVHKHGARSITACAAVDDLSEEVTGYPAERIPFVRTEAKTGLTEMDAMHLITLLGRKDVRGVGFLNAYGK